MKDYDVNLGLDWLEEHYALADCRVKKITFCIPGEDEFSHPLPRNLAGRFVISAMKVMRMVNKVCHFYGQELDEKLDAAKILSWRQHRVLLTDVGGKALAAKFFNETSVPVLEEDIVRSDSECEEYLLVECCKVCNSTLLCMIRVKLESYSLIDKGMGAISCSGRSLQIAADLPVAIQVATGGSGAIRRPDGLARTGRKLWRLRPPHSKRDTPAGRLIRFDTGLF
ncbi:hypothetical protein Taro_001054 [Colocasia esculenta]|uniref:Uncharacterized protein n=1 Tax=Colocasia esculenta TaxID=4460 RepID=A0A843TGY3_COLES|nr:hypothetical protein [Colocasia esculenta]